MPLASTVHCWAAVPLQSQIWILVPLLVPLWLSSRQSPDETPETIGPVALPM